MREVLVDRAISNGGLARLFGVSLSDVNKNASKYIDELRSRPSEVELANKAYNLTYVLKMADLSDVDGESMSYYNTVKGDLMKVLVAMADFSIDKEVIIVPVTTSSSERKESPKRKISKTKTIPAKTVTSKISPSRSPSKQPEQTDTKWEHIVELMKAAKEGKNTTIKAMKNYGLDRDSGRAARQLYNLLYDEYTNSEDPDIDVLVGLVTYYDIKAGKKDRDQLLQIIEFNHSHPDPYREELNSMICKS